MKRLAQLTLALAPIGAAAQDLPNILVYIADDHGFEHCEPYGDTTVQTPNLAKMADEGVVFDRAYVASPASGPSRSALLSALMPTGNGALENHQMPKVETQTMVKQLQACGYDVAAFGKVAHNLPHSQMSVFDHLAFKGVDKVRLPIAVNKYLSNRTSKKPLCLMVGDRRPHVPWTSEMKYDPATLVLPDNLIDTKETREHFSRYLTDIEAMDKTLGEVEKLARDYFGGEVFLFIYTADHGAQLPFGKWNLYERGAGVPLIVRWKGVVPEGQRTDAMVSWIDLFPTLIDVAGGKAPQNVDGFSFAKVLKDPTAKHRDEIYTYHNADELRNLYPIRSVRNERYNYIRNLWPDCQHSNHSDIHRKDGAGAFWDSWDELAKSDPAAAALIEDYFVRPAEELYDLKNDPLEKNNLAQLPEYKKIVKQMSNRLDQWMKQQGDVAENLPSQRYPISEGRPVKMYDSKVAAAAAAAE